MPGPNVIVEMDANETRLLRAFTRAEDKMGRWAKDTGRNAQELDRLTSKMVKDMDRAAHQTIKNARRGGSAFRNMRKTAIGNLNLVANRYLGLQTMMEAFAASMQKQIELAEQAKEASLDVAGAQQSAIKNLVAFSPDDRRFVVDTMVKQIARDLGIADVKSLTLATGKAASAGAGSPEEINETVRAAAKLSTLNQEEIDETSVGITKAQRALGVGPEIAAGAMLLAGGAADITESAKLIRNVPGALNTAMTNAAKGMEAQSAREALAAFPAATKALSDDTGERSRQAVVLLDANMKKFFEAREHDPGSFESRRSFIEKNDLAATFHEEMGAFGDATAEAFFKEMLGGGKSAQFAANVRNMLTDTAAQAKFDEEVGEFRDSITSEMRIANREAQLDAAIMLKQLESTRAVAIQQQREITAKMLESTRTHPLDNPFEWVLQFAREAGIRGGYDRDFKLSDGDLLQSEGVEMGIERMLDVADRRATSSDPVNRRFLTSGVQQLRESIAGPSFTNDPNLRTSLEDVQKQRSYFLQTLTKDEYQELINVLKQQLELQEKQLEMASQSASANQATANAASQTAANTDPANRRPDTATAMRVADALRNRSTGR